MNTTPFRAAACAVDISPDLDAYEIRLHGYGARGTKTAEGIHDALHGKVLVMQRGATSACLITMDILQIDGLLLDAVAERAAIPGLGRDRFAVCASHTHSAPAALQKRTANLASTRLRWYQPDYYEHCVEQLASGVREAFEKLRHARCAVAAKDLGARVRNRRVPSYDYDTRGFTAPVEQDVVADNEMVVAQFRGWDGDVIATLVNLAAHGTVLGSDNMLVSADWAGYMQREVENALGGVCLYSNGAEGNLAPDCGPGPLGFAAAEEFGSAIAREVAELAGSLEFREPRQFDIRSRRVALPEYQISARSPYMRAGLDPEFVDSFIRESYPDVIQQTLIRVDEAVMLTIPGEMFTEHALDFKRRARELGAGIPLILGLANDSIGYVVWPEEYPKPGYETGMCVYGPGLGVALIDEGLSILGDLLAENTATG